jgi:hypothetical protein
MNLCKLKDAPASLIDLLSKAYAFETLEMRRYRDKETFDLFDFPGTSPEAFDKLTHKYEAFVGNHRNGFNVSKLGIKFLARLPVEQPRMDAWDAFAIANRKAG